MSKRQGSKRVSRGGGQAGSAGAAGARRSGGAPGGASGDVSGFDAGSRLAKVIGASDLAVGVLVLGAVWGVLPTRWMPLDAPASLLGVGFVVAGLGLLLATPWAPRVARVVAWVSVVGGAGLFTALALTAAHISGLYGPVGAGGATLLFVVALLLVPYLVLLPAAQLWVLAKRGTSAGAGPGPEPG